MIEGNEIYGLIVIGLVLWGTCGVLLGRLIERLRWNDLIHTGNFPNPVEQPLEFEVLSAAKAYVREHEHPVGDGRYKAVQHKWLVEAVNDLQERRFRGDMS